MKKAEALLLCMVLVISTLAGCSGETDDSNASGSNEVYQESGCEHISWTYLNRIACQCDVCGFKQSHSWVTDEQNREYCEFCFSPGENSETEEIEDSGKTDESGMSGINEQSEIPDESQPPEESNEPEESIEPEVSYEPEESSEPSISTEVNFTTSIDSVPYSDATLTYKYSAKQIMAPQCIPVGILASSEQGDYAAERAIDGDNLTCWREGNPSGWGEGESITVFFDGIQSLYYISFYLGDQKNSDSYYATGRPKELLFEFSDGERLVCEMEDKCSGWQTMLLSHKVVTSWVKVSILSAYPGTDTSGSKDTGITEIGFYTYEDTVSFKVVYNGVKLRSGPSLSSNECGTVSVGYLFTAIELSDDKEWIKFICNGTEVWVWLALTAPLTVSFN